MCVLPSDALSCSKDNDAAAFEAAMAGHVCAKVGQIVSAPRVKVEHEGAKVLDVGVEECVKAWKKPFAA